MNEVMKLAKILTFSKNSIVDVVAWSIGVCVVISMASFKSSCRSCVDDYECFQLMILVSPPEHEHNVSRND